MNLKYAKLWVTIVAVTLLLVTACSPTTTDTGDTDPDDNVVEQVATEIVGIGGIPTEAAATTEPLATDMMATTEVVTTTEPLSTGTADSGDVATAVPGSDDDDMDDADLDDADKTAIYTAVIRQILDTDDTFGGTLEKPVVYILTRTDDAAGDPTVGSSESETIDDDVREGITAALSDAPSTITWIDSRDQLELEDNGSITGGGVLITLGNIHPQEDGTQYVGGSIYVGSLAAGGNTYILENQGGTWTITGKTGMGWVS